MLAQHLFFIFLFSIISNSFILFSMEKPRTSEHEADQLKRYNKALQYLADVEKARQKPHPAGLNKKKDTLMEATDEIQQKIVSKKLKQAQINRLAEEEIGLKNRDCLTDYVVTVVFENNTSSTFYIKNKKLEPKKTITVETPLLQLTHRISNLEIPIYDADTIQIFPLGPCIVRNSKKLIATLEATCNQMIPELPEQTFYAYFTSSDSELKKQSNLIDGEKKYHTYVVLTEKKDQPGNTTLESFLGAGLSHYEAAKHAQEQQNEIARHLQRQKTIASHQGSQKTSTESSAEDQSSTMKGNEELSTVSVNAPNAQEIEKAVFKINERVSRTYQGTICASQSATNIKPAYPPAKHEAPKEGSIIYGSLRRAKQAFERTVSLTDVKKEKINPHSTKKEES